MLDNNVSRLCHMSVVLHEREGIDHELCTYIFPALQVLVSVGSEGFRNLYSFSENICYMSRGRELLRWAGGSTSIDYLGGIREKTAFLSVKRMSELFSSCVD